MEDEITKRVELEQRLYNYDGPDRVVSIYDVKRMLQTKPPPEWRLNSGLLTLDTLIGGFLPSEVTVISGLTGEGKTTLCQTFTREFYAEGNKCLWFSYEVRPGLFISKYGRVLPEFYTPAVLHDKSINWIYKRIYEGKLKHGIQAVFIDHLHYLIDLSAQQSVSIHIGGLMRNLVRIAHELELHIFLIAHMQKIKRDSEPDKGDARDSSFVEQEADNVFYIWRVENKDNEAVLKIAKNRRNGVWKKKINLVYRDDHFEELDPYR